MPKYKTTRELPHLRTVDLSKLPTATGILQYDPKPLSHSGITRRSSGMLILQCGPGWLEYLRHQARYAIPRAWTRFTEPSHGEEHGRVTRSYLGLTGGLQPPALGSHISIVYPNEYLTQNRNRWRKDEGRRITFRYHPTPVYTGKHALATPRKPQGRTRPGSAGPEARQGHVWYPVWSDDLLDLRAVYGLRRNPKYQLHLTVATWVVGSPVRGNHIRVL